MISESRVTMLCYEYHVTSHNVMWHYIQCHVALHAMSCGIIFNVTWLNMQCHVALHAMLCDVTKCHVPLHAMSCGPICNCHVALTFHAVQCDMPCNVTSH